MKLPPIRSWLRPRLRAAKVDVAATIESALRVLPGAKTARPASASPLQPPFARDRAPAQRPANDDAIGPGFWPGRHGTRVYRLFVPEGDAATSRALIVMLHGCTQHPVDFATGTRMNDIAAAHGVLVVYPEQPASANGARCWNWFRPEDQRRGTGEPESIAALVRHVASMHRVDADRVYVAGLSAGGAMAAVLAQQYPETFAAVGVHSGLAPGAASDAASAFAAMRQGTRPAPLAGDGRVPVIVFHGDRDTTVHPANAARVLAALLPRDASEESVDTPEAKHSVHRYAGRVVGESWMLRGVGHAWSGGSAAGSHTHPSGVDASAEMVRFFLEHPRGR